MAQSTQQPVVVIPNLDGGEAVLAAVRSLTEQSLQPHIILVDNASSDGSADTVAAQYPMVEIIRHDTNKGYAGGVNPGLQRAIDLGATYAAPFNDDALADRQWLKRLVDYLDAHPEVAAANPKVLTADAERLDTTGECYTSWGLPYPRGRREYDTKKYDAQPDIFAASGAASLYRVSALEQVGLLDEDFFAYYEDVDLGFRLQLTGWKASYVPGAVVYHDIGMTSGRVKGFTTLQTLKNQPLLLWKNMPRKYLWRVGWRFFIAHSLFFARATSRGLFWQALKGDAKGTWLLATGFKKRRHIQKSRKVSDQYIWGLMVHDLPPNATALRSLRAKWWRLARRNHHE